MAFYTVGNDTFKVAQAHAVLVKDELENPPHFFNRSEIAIISSGYVRQERMFLDPASGSSPAGDHLSVDQR